LPAWLDVSIFGLTLIVMLVGLFGLVIPIFPGVIVIWLAALGYGVVSGFTPLGIGIFIVMTLLMLASTVVDNVLMGAGARKSGASWVAILVATVAGIAGTLLLPPIGGLLAAPLAVLLVEILRVRDWNKALQAMRGLAIGMGFTVVARFGIGVVMILLWGVWAWSRR
jgi:uncharacterized protein YqgC (DUF456 family)